MTKISGNSSKSRQVESSNTTPPTSPLNPRAKKPKKPVNAPVHPPQNASLQSKKPKKIDLTVTTEGNTLTKSSSSEDQKSKTHRRSPSVEDLTSQSDDIEESTQKSPSSPVLSPDQPKQTIELYPNAKQRAKNITIRDTSYRSPTKGKVQATYQKAEIREPRSFKDMRVFEVLRWISTVVKASIDAKGGTQEVQACIYNGQLIIATNENKNNNVILEQIREKKFNNASEYLRHLITELPKKGQTDRIKRHASQLQAILEKFEKESPQYNPFSKAIIIPMFAGNQNKDGLHAERRIALYVGEKEEKNWEVNHDYSGPPIAGVKRPCETCFSQLFQKSPDQLKKYSWPGPYWPSDAANINVSPDFKPGNILTAVTKTRNDKLTISVGTESRSDKKDDDDFSADEFFSSLIKDKDWERTKSNDKK